jgi:6-phosphofructokinase 2
MRIEREEPMHAIVTLTMNPAIDTSTRTPTVAAEHKLRCGPPRHDPGGGGVNVARAISQLGGAARVLYMAGGLNGQLLQQLLDQLAVPQQPITITSATRQSFTILEESSTLQYRFNLPGPTIQEDEWPIALNMLAELDPPPAYLVASGSLPPGVPDDFYAQVAELGRVRGMRVIVDTSGQALCKAAEAGVFLLKPNLRELGMLAGRELASDADQEQVARDLVGSGCCEAVLVSLGAAGALLVTAEICRRVRSPTVPIISKVGAGDSTVAGITLALARSQPLEEAARFGIACGAAAVMTPGTELCRRADAERLYAQLQAEAGSYAFAAAPHMIVMKRVSGRTMCSQALSRPQMV